MSNCLIVINYISVELCGFQSTFINIISFFLSVMSEEGKAKISGLIFGIKKGSSKRFSNFPKIVKLRPDLGHLTPGLVVFPQ